MEQLDIKVSKFGTSFSNRRTAVNMIKEIQVGDSNQRLILDMENVEDATPSFLHELITRLLKNFKEIFIKGENKSVRLQVLKVLQTLKKKEQSRIKLLSVTSN